MHIPAVYFYTTEKGIEFIKSQPEGARFCTYVSHTAYLDGRSFLMSAYAVAFFPREEAVLFVGSLLPTHLEVLDYKIKYTVTMGAFGETRIKIG